MALAWGMPAALRGSVDSPRSWPVSTMLSTAPTGHSPNGGRRSMSFLNMTLSRQCPPCGHRCNPMVVRFEH